MPDPTVGPQFDSDDDDDPTDDEPHDARVKYEGVLPYGWCSCGWDGPTRDHEREASDDVRAHRRASQD